MKQIINLYTDIKNFSFLKKILNNVQLTKKSINDLSQSSLIDEGGIILVNDFSSKIKNIKYLSNNYLLIVSILVLALALTLSTIDTLINAISSILIVNGNQISKSIFSSSLKNNTNYIISLISILVFILASKGYSVLYLFLLADLFCCAAVVTIFYGFFNF